jgi:hypothetical protein
MLVVTSFFFFFFLSWHKVQKILKKLFIIENWIFVIHIPIFSTLTLVPGGHQLFVLLFYAIELLGIMNDLLLYEKQVWNHKYHCD